MTEFRNRIVGHDLVDPKTLTPNALNFRTHPERQSAATEGSLKTVGWVDELLINLRTGEEWPPDERNVPTLVNGHDRRKIAVKAGITAVPARYVDLTPAEEKLVLASFDAITNLAEMDEKILADLLQEVELTPVEDPGLAALLESLAEDAGLVVETDEPVPPPPPESAYQEQYGVIVICADEDEQRTVYEKLLDEGYEVKVVAT